MLLLGNWSSDSLLQSISTRSPITFSQPWGPSIKLSGPVIPRAASSVMCMHAMPTCADARPFQLERRAVRITHMVLVAEPQIAIALPPCRRSRFIARVIAAGIENARWVEWSKPFSCRGAFSEKRIWTW